MCLVTHEKDKSSQAMDEDRFIPGTVHLVDAERILHAKHASGLLKDVVLVPPPSDDPDDPLNWSRKRKLVLTASMCVCVTLPHASPYRTGIDVLASVTL